MTKPLTTDDVRNAVNNDAGEHESSFGEHPSVTAERFDAWLDQYDPELEGVVAEGAIVRVVDYRQNLINIADQIENELVPALRAGGLPSEPVEDGAKLFREVVEDLRKVLANIPLQTFAVVAEDPRLGGGRGAFGQQL